ncbi:MAG: DUF948 domain-containing protein [Mycobacteriales bacterium]
MVSIGGVAVLILAVFWAVLVGFLCFVLIRLGGVLQSTEELVDGITERTVPLLGEVTTTVVHVNEELVRVDAITSNVQTVTSNLAGLAGLFAATLGSPLVKVAAFSYGVRRAASNRRKADLEKEVRANVKAQRRGSGRFGRRG